MRLLSIRLNLLLGFRACTGLDIRFSSRLVRCVVTHELEQVVRHEEWVALAVVVCRVLAEAEEDRVNGHLVEVEENLGDIVSHHHDDRDNDGKEVNVGLALLNY